MKCQYTTPSAEIIPSSMVIDTGAPPTKFVFQSTKFTFVAQSSFLHLKSSLLKNYKILTSVICY